MAAARFGRTAGSRIAARAISSEFWQRFTYLASPRALHTSSSKLIGLQVSNNFSRATLFVGVVGSVIVLVTV